MRYRLLRLLPVFTFVFATLANDPDAAFFKARLNRGWVDSQLDSSGWLTLSNVAPGTIYSVMRSRTVDRGPWEPLVSGKADDNGTGRMRVAHFPPKVGFSFVPGGIFDMGDALGDHNSISGPVHQVTLSPFLMLDHEVTNEELGDTLQWAYDQKLIIVEDAVYLPGKTNILMDLDRFAQELNFAGSRFSVRSGRERHPAAYISWFGAVAFCHFRNLREGIQSPINLDNWTCDFSLSGYRLPTEAEWECAARGGYSHLRFPWPDTNVITHAFANYQSDTNVNYDASSTRGFHPLFKAVRPYSSPVGSFPANSYGLFDMIGNVYEWTWDRNDSRRYSSFPEIDPTGPESGRFAIPRGGSWFTTAERATVSVRYVAMSPASRVQDVGFRIVFALRPATAVAPQ